MEFSIIVPTRNRYVLLKKHLDRLLFLDYPKDKYEVIVVNNSAEDDQTQIYLRELSKKHKNFRFHQEMRLGPSFARNAGIKMAKYPFHILIDDDIEVKKTLLKEFVLAWQKHSKAIAIGGKIIAKPTIGQLGEKQERLITKHSWVFGQQDKGSQEVQIQKGEMLCSGTLGLHQKEKNLILFDHRLGISLNPDTILYGEDSELCTRLFLNKHEIWYVPDIITINHFNRQRLTDKYLSKRYFTNGLEIYLADSILKKHFPHYDSSYGIRLKQELTKLLFFNFSVFKKYIRTKYDFIMIFSYFFCGRYF
ncbi:MAG: glycosyltransferase family 2 protein [Patescibacteria group bacterium]